MPCELARMSSSANMCSVCDTSGFSRSYGILLRYLYRVSACCGRRVIVTGRVKSVEFRTAAHRLADLRSAAAIIMRATRLCVGPVEILGPPTYPKKHCNLVH